ncbi:hypothetical protein LTR37_015897 [Vermiconidia calcicola]|uniref:Uncharacterized protein n=1 Tax=Vermiconidia calcicola TaxID=1690605 RepID=A0ACC3MQL2_9PEZI|nr:hypothetical protein LTR37_015897 [Vermiconidia calcicola]
MEQTTQVSSSPDLPRAVELIGLLDRYLRLTGRTLTSHHSNPTEAITSVAQDAVKDTNDDDVPVSLRIFPAVSLSDHLKELERVKQELKDISARVKILYQDEPVVDTAKELLTTEYLRLTRDVDVFSFRKKSVGDMLAIVRAEQKRPLEPAFETFTINLVDVLMEDGGSANMATRHINKNTSWNMVQEVLSKMSLSWQATQAGYPHGYSLEDGKWLYQFTKRSIPRKELHDLKTAQQYREMQNKMRKEGLGILVWHEKVWQEAQARKAAACLEEGDEDVWKAFL